VILLELAAQGVRGVAPAGGRAALRPGYNVVSAEGAILRRLLEALLHPDAGDAVAIPRAAGGPAGAPVRAGLTLIGDDRVTYRLVRDFAEGAQLHRFDAAQRAFALVSRDLREIAAVLQDAGVPPPARADVLLALRAAELPSRQAARGLAAGPRRQALGPDQARRRLEQLEAERARAQAVERLQRELDALQSRGYALDEVLRGGATLRDAVVRAEAARGELEKVAWVAATLGDAESRLAVFEVAAARRDDGVARLETERAAIAEAEAAGPPAPFWSAPPFWAGIAGGAVVALAGLGSAASQPGLRTLALLDIPAFGWSAWIALRWVSGLEAWERVSRRRRVLDDWEGKLAAQHARDGGDVATALKALGLTRPDELREALERLGEADRALAAARQALAQWEAGPAARGAAQDKARVEAEHRALEARLAAEADGGFVRDVRAVEQEVQRVEAEMAGGASPDPATAAAGERVEDPLLALLERAARALGGSAAAAARAVAPRASQALAGLGAQRLGAIEVDDRAGLNVALAGRRTPAVQLPAADRDLVFVALKLALLERELAAGGRVALVDGALDLLPEGARRFAARLLKQIARGGQIVHATPDPSFREAADHAA
jgi:tetratricopeptide (TPR) repeat protein